MKQELEIKEDVRCLLTSLEEINPNEISKEDGLMDFEKVGNHPKIKEVFGKLNEMGITRKYLMDNFFLAGMTLGHILNN